MYLQVYLSHRPRLISLPQNSLFGQLLFHLTIYPITKHIQRREQHSECSYFTIFSFLKRILCPQKVITYHWIHWRKVYYVSYSNFRNIFLIMDYGNKNLRILSFVFIENAPRAAPCATSSGWSDIPRIISQSLPHDRDKTKKVSLKRIL